VEGEVGGTHAP